MLAPSFQVPRPAGPGPRPSAPPDVPSGLNRRDAALALAVAAAMVGLLGLLYVIVLSSLADLSTIRSASIF